MKTLLSSILLGSVLLSGGMAQAGGLGGQYQTQETTRSAVDSRDKMMCDNLRAVVTHKGVILPSTRWEKAKASTRSYVVRGDVVKMINEYNPNGQNCVISQFRLNSTMSHTVGDQYLGQKSYAIEAGQLIIYTQSKWNNQISRNVAGYTLGQFNSMVK